MEKKFKVLGGFNIIGRGEVLICKNDEALKVGVKVRINDKVYTINGKEAHKLLLEPPVPSKVCGLLLSPNKSVKSVEPDDIIEIIEEE